MRQEHGTSGTRHVFSFQRAAEVWMNPEKVEEVRCNSNGPNRLGSVNTRMTDADKGSAKAYAGDARARGRKRLEKPKGNQ